MTKDTQSAGEEPSELSDLAEAEHGRDSLMPGTVVRVIIGLALVWILILAYFVARMPAK